jgi:hypothetical protein
VGSIRARRGGVYALFLISIHFLNRRVPPVKFFTRGLVLFVLSLGMFVVVGCGVDNEEEGKKLAKSLGAPPPASTKGAPATPQTPPATEADRGKQILEQEKGMSYPSGKKSGR